MKEAVKLTARKLRKYQTEPEKILWEKLRGRRYFGYKFTRQKPIIFEIEGKERFFIADFFCNKIKLVIELDGKVHLGQKENDQFRDLIINELGVKVLRVENRMIEEELDYFLADVLKPLFNNSPSLRKRRGGG